MRAFIAIDLPGELLKTLAHRQAEFGTSLSAASDGGAGVSWVRPEGIHLTLKFLGEITPRRVSELSAALDLLGPFSPFQVEVRGLGFFPDARRPRVFWAGVVAGPELPELAKRIEDVTERLGYPSEGRSFSPHLTLARLRDGRPHPALLAAVNEFRDASFGVFEVSEFYLFESRLRPGAPAEYRKVARFPLVAC